VSAIFIDTSAIVALFDRKDRHHVKARKLLEIIKKKKVRLLLSDYIFDESGRIYFRKQYH
jgi:predicted nucleic acid-binding protein